MSNNEWIEINLPWWKEFSLDRPDYPAEITEQAITKQFGKHQEDIKREFKEKHNKDLWEVMYEISEDDDHPLANEVNALSSLLKDMENFELELPEAIKWEEECEQVRLKEVEESKKHSFRYSDLRRPGVLLEVQQEGSVKQHLIGNVNAQGGLCNCCSGFRDNAIVLRAKVLIEGLK